MKKKTRKKLENLFCKILTDAGFNFATGVPCGVQKYIIANLSKNQKIKHVPATREAEAVGIAAGAYLAGKTPLVYMQNSGLMDCLNDITSLLITYKIPVLLLVSWRGAPGEDAPQHLVNGRITIKILRVIGIPTQILRKTGMQKTVLWVKKMMKKKGMPAVILIKRNTLQ